MSSQREYAVLWEKFADACDKMERDGIWETEQYGGMKAYFANDMLCILLKLAASDKIVTYTECDMINDIIGTTITRDEANEILTQLGDVDGMVSQGYALLRELDAKAAGDYKDMIRLACIAVSESDSFAERCEQERMEQFLARLN